MTKRARTTLFIFCVFLFFFAAPSVVLYSQGYRFDFERKNVVQTGAFYFKTAPKGADVYVNGKLEKKTSALTGSALIENLLPKSYVAEIKKAGFHSWLKTLEVKEKEVTEAKNIILFPRNPNFNILNNGENPKIAASATSSDKKKVVSFTNYEIWILFLEDQNSLPIKKAGEKIFLTRFSEEIGDVFWLTSHYLIFDVGNEIKIAEIDDRDRLNVIDLAEFRDPEMSWDDNSKKLFVSSEGKLYVLENLLP